MPRLSQFSVVLLVLLCVKVYFPLWAQDKPQQAGRNDGETAEAALLEMVHMEMHYTEYALPRAEFHSERAVDLDRDTLLRDNATRLVRFLRHSDEHVRLAAFDLLTATQPNGPGSVDSPEKWEEWLAELRESLGIKEPKWIAAEFTSIEDVLLDILAIRTQYQRQPSAWFLRDNASRDALRRLVRYLRHPEARVREASLATLTLLQRDRPGGADEPDLWDSWLKKLELSAEPQKVRETPSESSEVALWKMLSIPHWSTWANTSPTNFMKRPDSRDHVKLLIRLLRHSDMRVRLAAFNLLISIQPVRRGSADDPAAWEAWLESAERAFPLIEPKKTKENAKPVEDVLCDIIRIRTHTKPEMIPNIVRDPTNLDVVRRLVSYLSHPDWRVRSPAFKTLSVIVLSSPGNPKPSGDSAVWEDWLKDLENNAGNK